MNKKIIIFAIALVLVVILGVSFAKLLSGSIETRPTASNRIENKNSNKDVNNQAKNETNKAVENKVSNEVNNISNSNVTDEPKVEEPKTDLEKAIEIVEKDWGTDNTVYYAQDGQNDNGEYIICVRDKETTSAKAWYTVNVQTGTFVKK